MNGGLTLQKVASWQSSVEKMFLFFALVSVAFYPILTAVYAILYLLMGVWSFRNGERIILSMTGAEELDLEWVRSFLREYGMDVERVYLVRGCFLSLLTGRSLFVGEKLLDFEPDRIRVGS